MKLRTKLLLSFLFSSIVPLVAVSYYTLEKAEAGFDEKEKDILESSLHDRATTIISYYDSVLAQIDEVSDNSLVTDAINDFTAAFNGLKYANLFTAEEAISFAEEKRLAAVTDFYANQFGPKFKDEAQVDASLSELIPKADSALRLQYSYIAANPNPLGDKNDLVRAEGGGRYHHLHEKYHSYFNRIINTYGYYDIFLVEPKNGEVIYSVYKEIDFATSLVSGPHANSGLAHSYKAALADENKTEPSLVDFQRYVPSYNAPASFISKPIHENGKLIGVLIFQLPIERLNKAVNGAVGLGETGKAFLLSGADGLLRTQLPSVSENTILEPFIAMDQVEKALVDGGYTQYTDYLGNLVQSSTANIDVLGQAWQLVVEQDASEAFRELAILQRAYHYAFTLSFIFAIGVALWLLRNIRNQLGAEPDFLDQIASEIAEGNLNRDFSECSKQPTGILDTMVSMQSTLKARDVSDRETMDYVSQLRDGLQKLTTPVALAASDHRIMFINTALEETLQTYGKEIQSAVPGFDPSDILSATMSQFSDTPGEMASTLSSLSGVYECEFIANSRIFKLVFNAIYSASNERIGTSMEWQDITDDRAVMTEVDEVVRGANNGKLESRISVADKSGVYLGLSNGINGLLDVNQGFVTDVSKFLGAISGGDLTSTIDRDYHGAFADVKRDANKTVQKLMGVVTDIRTVASTVDKAAQEINAGNSVLSARTEQAATSLQETSASMKEMTESVAQTADNSSQAKELALATKAFAEKGGEVVGQAIVSMEGINNSSQKIVDIIDVIDDIAFQTNLLALNASVEAARAGEQGRGFAVVASEVRNLASRSATAAKEIKDLIEDSVVQVQKGSQQVNESGRSLEGIVSQVGKVTDVISEISVACQEQSEGIGMVNSAITQLDGTTQQNAALVAQGSAESRSTSDQAANLIELIEFFSTTSAATKKQDKLKVVG